MGFKILRIGDYVKNLTKTNHYGTIVEQLDFETFVVEYAIPYPYKEIVNYDDIIKFEKGSESFVRKPVVSKEQQIELLKVYIDLALQTNDKDWFLELTNKLSKLM